MSRNASHDPHELRQHHDPPQLPDTKPAATQAICERLFTYGTLMNRGTLIKQGNIVPEKGERATMSGRVYKGAWFPTLIEGGEEVVHGVVWTIPKLAEDPAIFDRYEGSDKPDPVYSRVIREATTESGERQKVWVYVGNPKNGIVQSIHDERHRIRYDKDGAIEEHQTD